MRISKINPFWRILEFRRSDEARQIELNRSVWRIRADIARSYRLCAANTPTKKAVCCCDGFTPAGTFLVKNDCGEYYVFTPDIDTRIDAVLAQNITRTQIADIYCGGVFCAHFSAQINGVSAISSKRLFGEQYQENYERLGKKSVLPKFWKTYALLNIANKYLLQGENTYADMIYGGGMELDWTFASLREFVYLYYVRRSQIPFTDSSGMMHANLFKAIA